MHGSQHASNEFIDPITFLYQGNQCRNSTLVVGTIPKMSEDELLEGINLILECHQISDCFVSMWKSAEYLNAKVWLSLALRWDR